jgi:hypothetical protein
METKPSDPGSAVAGKCPVRIGLAGACLGRDGCPGRGRLRTVRICDRTRDSQRLPASARVSDFSLLRPRFIYAGILVFLSLGITWAHLMLAQYRVGESLKNLWTRRPALWWGRFVGVLGWGLILAAFTPLAIFVIAMRVGPSWRDAGPAVALWVAGLVLGLVMTGAAEGIIRSKARRRELPVAMVPRRLRIRVPSPLREACLSGCPRAVRWRQVQAGQAHG